MLQTERADICPESKTKDQTVEQYFVEANVLTCYLIRIDKSGVTIEKLHVMSKCFTGTVTQSTT